MMLLAVVLSALWVGQPNYDPPDPKVLFESGRFQDAVDAIAGESQAPPDHIYLAALSYLRLNQPDNARAEFARLAEAGSDNPWSAVGTSGEALVAGDKARALEQAQKAISLGPGVFAGHYQAGLVYEDGNRWAEAAAAFAKATEIDGNFAYAHYHAGVAYQKDKRLDRTATHFEYFLRLAPSAPEVPAVQSILRTLRGK
ncbi:MAG: tetratricopeptide repeat protein [Vicinamibacterales bacterium]